jgi:DNA recombination protein RmuC
MVTQIVFLIIGIGIGMLIGYFAFSKKQDNTSQLISDEKLRSAESITDSLRRDLQNAKEEITQERTKSESRQVTLTRLQTENGNLVQRLSEQKLQQEELEIRFAKEFENLANRILDDKSKKFTEQNETQLKNILDPLKDRIKDFEKRVNETHNESEKERSALKEQLRMMSDMNKRMSEEAINLTKALKGDSKRQGNWGEMILEKVLEKSGLTKGREYDVQQSYADEHGSRLQPDVVIHLPGNKNLIIDSKVSLVAYEKYTSHDTDDKLVLETHLKEHLASIRTHVKGLSSKNYHNLQGISSPDFVLLFIPIEPAFMLSISMDNDLYNDAFEKNVVLVSPTTLLATLRTIANVWRQEDQSQNAMEIAKYSGLLYDKFVSFVDDLNKVGDKLRQAQDSYDDAKKKLHEGRGNLVKNAEYVKNLGAKTNKSLPKDMVEKAEE